MIHYSAPGKQFVSGEWAILEVGNLGLVAAVNKRVHSVIEEYHAGNEISISIKDFDLEDLRAVFDGKNLIFSEMNDDLAKKLQFIKESIEVALRYVKENDIEIIPFKIRTWGELSQITVNGQTKKIGFGSSASATVAVITSVLCFHGIEAEKEEIYKLATIAHYYAQGKVGSAFDVAASTYGGIFVYSRFDPDWLTKKMESGEKLVDIAGEKWPGLLVEQLNISEDLRFLIAWSGETQSTVNAVKQMNEFKKQNPEEYNKRFSKIADCARDVIDAWKTDDRKTIIKRLRDNEKYLRELGEVSGVPIETLELKRLSEIANKYSAGKLSGAGGGDCGIAICFDEENADKIISEWKEADLYPLDATIDREGVKKEN